MIRKTFAVSSALVAFVIFLTSVATAAQLEAEKERAERAADALEEILRAKDNSIPTDLLKRAYAVAVIPHVVKGAFVVGGSYGKGLVAKRNDNGHWGPPAYVEIGGGSLGFQIGVQATDLILVFVEEKGLDALLEDKLKLGADASVAAGPIGRRAEIGTNATLDAAIYSYSRTKGVFAGVSLDGSVLTIDDDANAKAYGTPVSGDDILVKQKLSTPAVAKPFVAALEKLIVGRVRTS
jgi:lipid-binding SYLF domain-containing protein